MPGPIKFTEQLETLCQLASRMARAEVADGMVLLLDGPTDWEKLQKATSKYKLLVVTENDADAENARGAGLSAVSIDMPDSPVYEKLTQALLACVADDLLEPGSRVVAIYSGFEFREIDSLSVIRLDEHLGRLTVRDLRQLETRVPLETLKTVVDLAVEIGREGREGKPVGTLFVVGDHRRVLSYCSPTGFDPVRGYNRKERNIVDPKVREGLKEIAMMDGAFVISSDGTVEAAAQFLAAPAKEVTLSKGLGARHWAAASISRVTRAIAIAVSESNGTVRIFNNGEIFLRIEPFRRAMKWKDFEYERPVGGE